MKKIIKNIIALSCFVIVGSMTTINAQQIPVLNQYLYESKMYNPASIGGETGWDAFLNYRKHWLGFDDAPVSQLISVSGSPFKKNNKMGVGLFIENDQANKFVSNLRAHLQYAYHILLTPEHDFSLGLAAGIANRQFRYTESMIANPENLWALDDNSFMRFDAGFGFNYKYTSEKIIFKLGTAIQQLPTLLTDFKVKPNSISTTPNYDVNSHILSNISVRVNAGNVGIEPVILYRSAIGSVGGGEIELGAKLSYMGFDKTDKIWVGGAMRTNNAGFHMSVGVIPQRNFNIFGSYEVNSILGSSFEVGVGFMFGRPQTAEELEAKQNRQEELALLQSQKEEEALKKKELQEQERLKKEKERQEEEARKAALREQEAIAEAKRKAEADSKKAAEEEAARIAREETDAKKAAEKERLRKEKEAAAIAKEKADAEARKIAEAKEKSEAEIRKAKAEKDKAEAEAKKAIADKEKAEAEARKAIALKEKAEADAKKAAEDKAKAEAKAKSAAEAKATKEAEEKARKEAEELARKEREAKEAEAKADPCSDVDTNVPDWIRPNGLQELLDKRNVSNDFSKADYKSTNSIVNIVYTYSDETDKYVVNNNMKKWVSEMTDIIMDAVDQCKTPRLKDNINSIIITSELLDSKDDLSFEAETGYDGEFGPSINLTYKSDGKLTTKKIVTGSITNEELALIKMVGIRDALIESLVAQGKTITKSNVSMVIVPGMEDNDYLRTTKVSINLEKAGN